MSNVDLWLKALHVIFVVTWFAGLFYLPRLFVYHASADDSVSRERFVVMEGKLYRIIMRPSMVLATGLGLWLLVLGWESFSGALWLWIKLAAVTGLLGYHYYCSRLIKAFSADNNPHSERFYRWFNELPVLILVLVVIMVVVKPF
ncbi:MAG: protoporphyrinogen oxidase HemJ [Pseudomonadales bacterium]